MSWLKAHIGIVDALLVAGVFLYNAPTAPIYLDSSSPADFDPDPARITALLGISAMVCLPYLWRRRHPLLVLAVMLLGAFGHVLLGAPLIAADVLLLAAVYNAATQHRWLASALGAAAVVVWVLIASQGLVRVGWLNVGEIGVLVMLIGWAWTWGTLVRIRRGYIAGLHDRAHRLEREQEALARIAVANERARIAREIHDVVSHSLGVVVVLSEGAIAAVDTNRAQAKSAMGTVRDTGRSALAEMRRMLDVLRENEPGSHAPQPTVAQLPELIDRLHSAGLPVTLAEEGEPVRLSAGLDLAVYRVVQESLTNVQKHAGPSVTAVEVLLLYRGVELEVRVRDDGRGTDQTAGDRQGHGLIGMRERVSAYDGAFTAGDRPGGGFEVAATLPIGGER